MFTSPTVCDSHGSGGCRKGKARPSRLSGTLAIAELGRECCGAQRSVCFGAIFSVPDMIIVTGFESSVLYFQIMDSPF